jgi:small subunit ribosomal protein S8
MMCWLADLIARLKNGIKARNKEIKVVFTNKNYKFLELLVIKGLINGFYVLNDFELIVQLKYIKGVSIINDLKILSKPSKRFYVSTNTLLTLYPNQILIISTNKGFVTRDEAIILNKGGELICRIK